MDQQLLDKFFKKECTEDEVKQVLRWFEKEKITEINTWKDLWTSQVSQEIFPTEEQRQMLDKIHQAIEKERSLPYRRYTPKTNDRYTGIAAAILLVIVSSLALAYFGLFNSAPSGFKAEQIVVKENPWGMKKVFHLHDSSTMYLNSGSRVEYAGYFTDKREILLAGEAYFEVKKNPEMPFIVRAGELTATALGTSFNVSSFEDDGTITVSLTSGKIQIDYRDNPENRLILMPGEQVVLNQNTGDLTKKTFDIEEITAWTRNKLVFKNASLAKVVKELERWYGVTITIENGHSGAGEHWNYSGEFTNESLRNVLNGISYVKDFTFKLEGKHAEIYLSQ